MSVKASTTALGQDAPAAGAEPGTSPPEPTSGEKVITDALADGDIFENLDSVLVLPQGDEEAEILKQKNAAGGGDSEGVDSAYEKSIAVSNLISFSHEEKHVLRGSPKQHILHRLGSILGNAGGAAWTYMLSQQVEYIDEFFSHNWSVKRWIKSQVLLFHYNRYVACIVTSLWALIFCGLTAADMMPTKTLKGYTYGYIGLMTTTPIFLLTVFAAHELQWLSQKVNHTVFLDKTCIHQTDKALQKAGIIKLGAFLGLSRRIVICYTDVYLRKLWTVYEIACFLVMHKISDMTLHHTSWIKLWVGGILLGWCSMSCTYIADEIEQLIMPGYEGSFGLGLALQQLTNIVAGVGLALLIRFTLVELNLARKRVAQFDVHAAMCFCEDDRPLVEGNIDLLLRFHGLIDTEATMEEALQVYNNMVRKTMPPVMDACMGADSIPYSICVCSAFPYACKYLVDDTSFVLKEEGISFAFFFLLIVQVLSVAFLGIPVIMQTFARVLGCQTQLTGWRNIAYCSSTLIGCVVAKTTWDQIPGLLIFPFMFIDGSGSYKVGGRVDPVWLVIMIVWKAIYIAYALFIFRGCNRRKIADKAFAAGPPPKAVQAVIPQEPFQDAKPSQDADRLVDADGCSLSEV